MASLRSTEKGQSLIELLVAIAIASLALPAILTGMVSSREGKAQEGQRIQAASLIREMREATKSIKEKGWNNLATDGIYHPVITGSSWSLSAGSETTADFERQLQISSVQRTCCPAGEIVDSGTLDTSTKMITYTVTWTNPTPDEISYTEYVQRYIGNTSQTHTSKTDFDNGVFVNTESTGGGTVQLSSGVQASLFTDDYTTSSEYSFNSSKIEVTGGYAQLKNQGSPVSGSVTNGTFNSNATGWTFVKYGDNVSQTGTYVSTSGNPGGYVRLNFPSTRNKVSGGFWRQPITTSVSNPTATLTFQYRVTAYAATPDNFRIYAYLDTATGTPVTPVWTSALITGTSAWSGTVTVNVASFMTTPATYYLKLAAYVDYTTVNRGPYTVGFDNVTLNWSGTSSIYASDNPTIIENTSFSDNTLLTWDSFTETSILNGGSIRYQLSDDDGATWKYYAGGASTNWVTTASDANYNSASEINSRISGFPVTNKKIRVKAYLVGNGTQQVRLDKIVIGYTKSSGASSGSYTSASIDAGSAVGFNKILWSDSNTSNTTTRFQVATNSNNTTWNYVGPDGTASTYFIGGNGAIPLANVIGRYIRYLILFDSTNTDIPSVSSVSVNYSP